MSIHGFLAAMALSFAFGLI